MIEAAGRLLQELGYHGTSLNDVLAASGAPRGSLYFHFPGGKDQLVLEATRVSMDAATQALQDRLAHARAPARAVRRFFDDTAQMVAASGFTLGCPVAPMVLDSPDESAGIAQLCREAFDTWTRLYAEAFTVAGLSRRRAESLALLVEASHEGALLIARARRDAAPIHAAAREIERVIAAVLREAARQR